MTKSQIQLLLASIQDLQGSIKANDSKSSAALVVHGLLFAGVLAISRDLGPTYQAATDAERTFGIVLLGLGLVFFVLSVFWLLRAVSPYSPKSTGKELECKYSGVFFPLLKDLRRDGPLFQTYRARINAMDDARVIDELSAETLKLADILEFESRSARWGYRFLRCEVIAVSAFLVYAVAVAIAVH